MKASSRRDSLRLSHTRWLAYATASLATALAATAEGEIHYSGRVNEVFDSEGFTRDLLSLSDGASLSFGNFASGHHFYDGAYFGVLGGAASNGFRASSRFPGHAGRRRGPARRFCTIHALTPTASAWIAERPLQRKRCFSNTGP